MAKKKPAKGKSKSVPALASSPLSAEAQRKLSSPDPNYVRLLIDRSHAKA